MKRNNHGLGAALLAASVWVGSGVQAAQHALVVGINDYAAFQPYAQGLPPGQPYDLLGARNDALRIAEALRRAGVALPQDRVLLDSAATEQAFLDAFERLKAQAQPGDTLIVTFAGHGAQETERSAPMDEADGRDEIIMFHDFDPSRPGTGRLTDDELQTLMQGASEFQVLWVLDSCHAGGLVRSARPTTLSRFGGLFDGLPDPDLSDLPPSPDEGTAQALPHVTQILATESEVLRVNETEIDGEMHGALSWHFAEAVSGAADTDGDNALTRRELAAFVETRVLARMNQSQQPRLFPRADDQPILTLTTRTADALPRDRVDTLGRVSVNFQGALPPGLDPELIRRVPTGATLTFDQIGAGRWDVYNHTGDRITTIDTTGGAGAADNGWPDSAAALVARARGLAALGARSVASLPPLEIEAMHGSNLMSMGDQVRFAFRPPDEAHRVMTLFNIAANGTVQPLFPTMGDRGRVSANGITLPFEVAPPTGADRLFALACDVPPDAFRAALRDAAGQLVTEALAQRIPRQGCQIGSIGLFTTN